MITRAQFILKSCSDWRKKCHIIGYLMSHAVFLLGHTSLGAWMISSDIRYSHQITVTYLCHLRALPLGLVSRCCKINTLPKLSQTFRFLVGSWGSSGDQGTGQDQECYWWSIGKRVERRVQHRSWPKTEDWKPLAYLGFIHPGDVLCK